LKKHDLFMRVFSLLRSKNCLLQFFREIAFVVNKLNGGNKFRLACFCRN